MTLHFHATGAERKRLAHAIGELIGEKPIYQFMPTCAYQIGGYVLDKEGNLHCDDGAAFGNLLNALEKQGFSAERPEQQHSAAAEPANGLIIRLPRDGFTDTALNNLHRLLASKGTLIRKALGVDALPVEVTDTCISFPWFRGELDDASVQAYIHFVTALADMAKKQKRVNARSGEPENEKYAFRCFLIRLGFVGSEYRNERRILLQNLSGNSAFKKDNRAKQQQSCTTYTP